MKKRKINMLGMEVEEWRHKSCIAHFGIGKNFATLYDIKSKQEGQGHATELLKAAKNYYEAQNFEFGGSVALNDRMRKLYKKLGIKEYA